MQIIYEESGKNTEQQSAKLNRQGGQGENTGSHVVGENAVQKCIFRYAAISKYKINQTVFCSIEKQTLLEGKEDRVTKAARRNFPAKKTDHQRDCVRQEGRFKRTAPSWLPKGSTEKSKREESQNPALYLRKGRSKSWLPISFT